MRKFTENDLDRSWSPEEVRKLSDRELTVLAFKRDLKNLVFFFPAAVFLYWAANHLGLLGQILGWIGIVLFAMFALQNLVNFLLGIFVIGTSVFVKEARTQADLSWRFFAVLLSAGNAVIYIAFALGLCDAILHWNIIAAH